MDINRVRKTMEVCGQVDEGGRKVLEQTGWCAFSHWVTSGSLRALKQLARRGLVAQETFRTCTN